MSYPRIYAFSQVLAVAAAVCVTCSVAAHAEAVNCPSGAFSGAYIGAGIGGGRSHAEQIVVPPSVGFDADDWSHAVGGYAGYNLQCGAWVLGIEGDLADTSFKSEVTVQGGPGETLTLASKVDWFGTIRGRLGLVVDNDLLLYGTAGLAVSGLTHSRHDTGPGLSFSASDSLDSTGWVVGGGIERIRNDNWSLRLEALYVDAGEESNRYSLCAGSPCYSDTEWDDSYWIARVGLTYRFKADSDPAYPAPLK